VFEGHDLRLKTNVGQPMKPIGASEEAFDVPIVFHSNRAIALPQQVCVVDDMQAIEGIWIRCPLQRAQSAGFIVMPAVVG
jgi:hypothetical protein